MTHKAPDSPGDATVDDELSDATRESMDTLGRPELDEEVEPEATDRDDGDRRPGQNSDWLPQ